MIPRLYEKTETAFTSFGIGPLSDAVECYVTEERNGAFFLEMTYPKDGTLAEEIAIDRIILAPPHDNASQWEPFRIVTVNYGLLENMQIYAEHISYQLNSILTAKITGTATDPTTAWALVSALSTNPFSFSSDITGTASKDMSTAFPVPIREFIGGMKGSIIDTFGGELQWSRYTVNLLSARGADNGVKIAYTKNLTGLNYNIDMSDLITGCVAYWISSDGQTYRVSGNRTKNNNYAYFHFVAVDASGDFDSTPLVTELNTYATNYLAGISGEPSLSLDVSFVPLWQTEEYKDFYALEHVALCDTVTVLYPPLNLNLKAKVVRTVYNVLADRYSEISISSMRKSLADTIVSLMKGTKK